MRPADQLEEYLRLEKESAKTYFAAYVDFIKWTTTVAIATIVWVSTTLSETEGAPLWLSIVGLVSIAIALILAILAFKAGVDRSAHFWDIARLNWSRALLDAFEKAGVDQDFVDRKRKELTNRFDTLSSAGDRLSKSAYFQRMAKLHVAALALGVAFYGFANVIKALCF